MRNLNPITPLINAQSNATGSSVAVDSNQLMAASFIASFSDAAAAGTLQIQASNDPSVIGDQGAFVPTNWVNVPGTTATAAVTSGANAVVYVPVNFVSKWLRITWTRSAGAGTYTVNMNAVGV